MCYNLVNKPIKEQYIENFVNRYSKIIDDNLIMDNDFEELNDISEYDSENIGINYFISNENLYNVLYEKINRERNFIKDIIEKKKNDMLKFIKEINGLPIPRKIDEENQYRILSFPWCISGEILTNLKYLNMNV